MLKPSNPSERLAGSIIIGLLIGSLVVLGIWFYTSKIQDQKSLSLEQALYVTDWDITKIYGPGTPQQASIVKQFQAYGGEQLKFDRPILYRMDGNTSGSLSDGILLMSFDPTHPETALYLKAGNNSNQ